MQRLRRLLPTTPARGARDIDIAVSRGASLTRQLLSFSRRQTHEKVVIDLGERLSAVEGILQVACVVI